MLNYFFTLQELEQQYQWRAEDLELQFRNEMLAQHFEVFMKLGNLSWNKDAGTYLEVKDNGLVWLFVGADNEDRVEAAGEVVVDCLDSYPDRGDFRNHMEQVFVGNYGGVRRFRDFIEREKRAGNVADVITNNTTKRIRY
ncbi:hypothetical protein HNV12_03715 [Methanococcoides sp. SA1]|nr:hypothetical protein [Methanococcoides sp. SA1]